MAFLNLDPTRGNDHIRFRFAGKPYKRSLRLEVERDAARVCGDVFQVTRVLPAVA